MKKHLYKKNINILYALSVMSGLTFSAALIVPFFNQKGLNQTEIMLLQTIFSLAVVLLEVPTGYIADHFSRKLSLRLGALMVGLGFISYSLVSSFAAFALCELMLAVGFAMLSGADEALLYDSLLMEKREDDFRHILSRKQSFGFGSVVIGAPLGSILASHTQISSVILADGLMALGAFLLTFMLVEPPQVKRDVVGRHPLRDMASVVAYSLRGHKELTRYILLGSCLSAATYFGYWLTPTYLLQAGVPIAYFGSVLAIRSLLKAVLAANHMRITRRLSDKRQLRLYAVLSVISYVALAAFVHPVAALFLLGFDVVQSLQGPVISHRVHLLTDSSMRAQVLSVMALTRRLLFAVLGPIIGLVVDFSLQAGLVFCAVLFGAVLLFLLSGKRE